MEQLFAELYVAECLGRLGRDEKMADTIIALRVERKANPFAPSPAMEELFACLDRGILDVDLVAHVRSYLAGRGQRRSARLPPLRLGELDLLRPVAFRPPETADLTIFRHPPGLREGQNSDGRCLSG